MIVIYFIAIITYNYIYVKLICKIHICNFNSLVFKELGVAMQAVKSIQIGDYVTGSSEYIESMANSVKNLTAQQQAYVLSANNVNSVQIREILTTNQLSESEINNALAKAGVVASTKKLTNAKVQEILTTQLGSEEKAKELANELGLVAATDAETISIQNLSYSQLMSTLAQKGLNAEQRKAIAIQLGYTTGTGLLTTALASFRTMVKGLITDLKLIGTSLKMFALSHPVITAITAAVAIGVAWWTAYKNEQKEVAAAVKEAREQEEERRSKLKGEIGDLNSIISEYEELGKKTELTSDEKKRLVELQDKLNQSYNTESRGIDLINGKYDEQIKKLKSLNEEETKRYIQSTRSARIDAFRKVRNNTSNDLISRELSKQLEYDFETDPDLGFYTAFIEAINKANINGLDFGAGNGLPILSEKLNSWQKVESLQQIKDILDRVTDADDKMSDSYVLLNNRIQSLLDGYSEEISSYESLLSEEVDAIFNSFTFEGINISNVTEETGAMWEQAMIDSFATDDSKLKQAIHDYYRERIIPTFEKENDSFSSTFSFADWFSENIENAATNAEKEMSQLQDVYKALEEGTVLTGEQQSLLSKYGLDKDLDNVEKLKKELLTLPNEVLSDLRLSLTNLYLSSSSGSDEEKSIMAALRYLTNISDVTAKVKDESSKTNDVYKAQKETLKQQLSYIKNNINKEEERKEAAQETLDTLEKQKDSLEKTLDKYDTAVSTITSYIDEQINSLEEQKTAIEDTYSQQIEVLESEAEEREKVNNLIEKQIALEKAKETQARVYDKERGGFRIETDKSVVAQAQKEYDEAVRDSEIDRLEKERDDALKPYDDEIKSLENYKNSWEQAAKSYQKMQDEMTTAAVFGSDWRNMAISQDTNAIQGFVDNYSATANRLHNIVEPQIEQTKNEIDTIDKQISKWKELQTQQQSYLDFFKNYGTQMSQAIGEQAKAVKDFVNAINGIAKSNGIVADKIWDLVQKFYVPDYIPAFANGGVSSSTGLAMLHGTKQKSEVTFNAEDAKKLYDMIHGRSSAQLTNTVARNIVDSAIQTTRENASIVNNNQPTKIENTWVINEPKFSSADDYRAFSEHMDRYVREANMNRLVGKK